MDLQQQAGRCKDCGIPFCHTGRIIERLTVGCPIHNLIPEFNDLIRRNLWRDAYDRLTLTDPFPEITGRICPAPCEGSCVMGMNQKPVAIKTIEQAIADRAFDEGWVKPIKVKKRSGFRVAVVGSGPAGLACAERLNRLGHQVLVFERADRPGGLLTYGIPEMKLEKRIVDRRIALLKAEGIYFYTGSDVGKNVSIVKLTRDFDALVLCIGATVPRNLDVPGCEARGVHFAMEYLTGQISSSFFASGKEVVVIGGGDTGADCVATAVKQGCKSIVQLEVAPQPPLSRAASNPWPLFPLTRAIVGTNTIRYETRTMAIESDSAGNVCGVRTIDGILPAQLVLIAIGFSGPEPALLNQLKLRLNRETFLTNVPGIFAAGDARRGQSLVVWAIREGQDAAMMCNRYLHHLTSTDPGLR